MKSRAFLNMVAIAASLTARPAARTGPVIRAQAQNLRSNLRNSDPAAADDGRHPGRRRVETIAAMRAYYEETVKTFAKGWTSTSTRTKPARSPSFASSRAPTA